MPRWLATDSAELNLFGPLDSQNVGPPRVFNFTAYSIIITSSFNKY